MITDAKELVDRYTAEFQALTGQKTCEALDWANEAISRGAESFEEILGRAAVKMQEGSADSGWLLGPLRLLWTELNEDQRLLIMALLRDSGALKTLLNRQKFPTPFTRKERAYLTAQFRAGRAVMALRRLSDG